MREIILIVAGNGLGIFAYYHIQRVQLGIVQAQANFKDNLMVLAVVEGVTILVIFLYWRIHGVPSEIYNEDGDKMGELDRELKGMVRYEEEREVLRQADWLSFDADIYNGGKKAGIKVSTSNNNVAGVEVFLLQVDGKDLENPIELGKALGRRTLIRYKMPKTIEIAAITANRAETPHRRHPFESGRYELVTQVGGHEERYQPFYRREICWELIVDVEVQKLEFIKLSEEKLLGNGDGEKND